MPDKPAKKKVKLGHPDAADGDKWDDFHNDPTSDVIIRSKDAIRFRASSYRLGQISTVLGGMFDLPSGQPTDVEMDFDSKAIRRMLDHAVRPDVAASSLALPVEAAFEFRRLVDFYDCKTLAKQAEKTFTKAVSGAPLDYLLLASSRNDAGMARKALSIGRDHASPLQPDHFLRTIARLRSGWRMPILYAMLRAAPPSSMVVQWPTAVEVSHLDLCDIGVTQLRLWDVSRLPPRNETQRVPVRQS